MADLSNYSRDEIEDALIEAGKRSEIETQTTDNGLVSYDATGLVVDPNQAPQRLLNLLRGDMWALGDAARLAVEDGEIVRTSNRDMDFRVDNLRYVDQGDSQRITPLLEAILDDPEPPDTSWVDDSNESTDSMIDGPRSWRGNDGEAGTDDDLISPDPPTETDAETEQPDQQADRTPTVDPTVLAGAVLALAGSIYVWRQS